MVKNITVYLDTDQLEFENSVRCGFIVSENDEGEETFHNDLIDSSEYHDLNDLVNEITGIFSVPREVVLVTV